MVLLLKLHDLANRFYF